MGLSLLVGELLTAVIVAGFSLLFRGEIATDYLVTGAVTCFVVAFIIVGAVLHINDRLRQAEGRLLAAEQERDALQEQLQRAQKLEAVGQLAGGIAHDFNNLLGAVIGNVEYVQQAGPDALSAEDLDEVLSDIGVVAAGGATLCNQLLSFAKRQPQLRQTLDLSAAVDGVLRLHRRVIHPSIALHNDVPPGLLIHADPSQLGQVLMNLCLNARDAMPKGGVLRVSAEGVDLQEHPSLPDGAYVRVVLADTGCGIDAATLQRVFEPFFTTKGPGEGTGLGLAVAYGLVQSHGGEIALQSTIGVGTTITLTLPRSDAAQVADVPAQGAVADVGPHRVLVVDDEDMVRRALCRILRALGHDTTETGSGAEALAAIASGDAHFDAVFLDMSMPGMDGLQTYQGLQSTRPQMPVFIMSGFDKGERIEQALREGAQGFLRKPVQADQLKAALSRL